MKYRLALILFVFLGNAFIQVQGQCRYKAKKFPEYYTALSTEYGGLFPNSLMIQKQSLQIEVFNYLAGLGSTNNQQALAGVIQTRYALSSHTEIQFGAFLQYPHNINLGSMYSQQGAIGIKQRFFKYEGRNGSWHLGIKADYVMQRSWVADNIIRSGFQLSLNSSWQFYRFLQINLSGGSQLFPSKNNYQPFAAFNLLMKDETSKVGIFMGVCADYIIESLGALGLILTDNNHVIILFSVGFSDSGIAPGISYTHRFGS